MAKALNSSTAFTPDELVAAGFPLHAREVTIGSGQGKLPRGAVLGEIAASGKHVLSAAAAEDGSQTPDVVLAEAVDATAADVTAVAYDSGEFLERGLTLGAGHTAASVRSGLRLKNIYLAKSR